MASEALRGRLAECKVSADGAEADLTCYLAEQPGGRKALLLVNKHPETKAEVALDIPGFKGKAVLKQLEESNKKDGPREEKLELNGKRISLPGYSITTILSK
jgi:hypothetical protein